MCQSMALQLQSNEGTVVIGPDVSGAGGVQHIPRQVQLVVSPISPHLENTGSGDGRCFLQLCGETLQGPGALAWMSPKFHRHTAGQT